MVSIQTGRASPKQLTIFQKQDEVQLGEICKEKLPQNCKNVGLGLKMPKEAIEGIYTDKKRPFYDNVAIRGRIQSGVVTGQMKM